MLSVSATFAADTDDIVAVDDEITEDTLATEVVDDSDELSDGESNIVTKDNFGDYFDNSGTLTSDADELVFEGDFSELDISAITIARDKPVKFTGHDATFKNVQFMIMQSGVTIQGFNLGTDESNQNSRLIWVVSEEEISDIVLSNNNITFIAPKGSDAYAIFAGAEQEMGSSVISGLDIINNNITFVGTDETKKNNVIRVNGNTYDKDFKFSEIISVEGNTFDIQMPSIPISYDPLTWAETPMSDGIVFLYCEDVEFVNNKVNIRYNKFTGSYDTINVVAAYSFMTEDFESIPCKGITIKDNTITGAGHNSIYGIKVAADTFNVMNNNISITSEEYYANGISVNGPSFNGKVENNTISISTPSSKATAVYGIYAWPMMEGVEGVSYLNNTIDVEGYLACGMEIKQPDPVITGNEITAKGNFTYGIAGSIQPEGDAALIEDNAIVCLGNNVGFGSGDLILKTGSAGISTLGSAIIEGNKIISTSIGVISVDKGQVQLTSNEINVTAIGKWDNYAVKVTEIESLSMSGNTINFVGTTDGQVVTNGVYIFDTNAQITTNTFNLVIPAADIIYGPAPTYEETIIAEGIVLDYITNLVFVTNNVTVTYGDIVGYYDTIRAIDVSNSNGALIAGNKIDAIGNSYIYALKLTGMGFNIVGNEITATSNNYANGVDIESPSSGQIIYNNITATAPNSAYPVYAGMNGQDLNMAVGGNNIKGESYYVVGVEIGGETVIISQNNIDVAGNHTIGIGTFANVTSISDNNISSIASNEGNEYVGDKLGADTTGIKVVKGNATISNNNVQTTGDYALDLGSANATVTDNYLAGKKAVGDNSVVNGNDVTVTGSGPNLKTIISAVEFHAVYDAGDVFYVTALDENGDPIKNAIIFLTINGTVINETTDNDGVATFFVDGWDVGDYLVTLTYKGNETYGPKSITTLVSIEKRVSNIVAPTSVNVLLTAVKKGSYYTITLKDDRDNGLAGEKVSITFNGKTDTYTTDELGVIKFKLSATKAGTQKLTVKFDSNSNYVDSTLTTTVKINKEATKLTAKKKTFKAKVKTKKYTVTLKDSKGKAIKKVKVTLKIKGKTYKAKTNAKGKATFKIKKLTKKGKYTAKVKFAGNNLYKAASKSVKITVKK